MRATVAMLARTSAAALAAAVLSAPFGAARAEIRNTAPPLQHMKANLQDRGALRTGAMFFMYDCSGCHGVRGARFTELADQLGLTRKQVQKYLNTTGRRAPQTITSSMTSAVAKQFLSKMPPDLTVIAKRHSVDWLYTYLKSFYLDPSRPTGVNNVVVHNVAMPDVFAPLQGLQQPVMKPGWRYGSRQKIAVGVKRATQGSMSPARFDETVRDIVSFLYAIAHPHLRARQRIGPWILGLLAALTVLSYLLYRQYWRRVVKAQGPRWWRYRGRR